MDFPTLFLLLLHFGLSECFLFDNFHYSTVVLFRISVVFMYRVLTSEAVQ